MAHQMEPCEDSLTGCWMKKFIPDAHNTNSSRIPVTWPYLSLNEQYMIYAEALNEYNSSPPQEADSGITWEKQKQMNVGFEATLLNHVDVSLDLFNQDRSDMLAQPYLTLLLFLGISNVGLGTVFPQSNARKVNNKGIEAMVRNRSDAEGDLQYYVQADIWYAKNKIVYNAEALQLYDYLYRTVPVNLSISRFCWKQ